MTPTERHLAQLIEAQGPISVATLMSVVLGHPQHGYYSVQRPFGRTGDFVTAPEVSQIFGELIGLWCVQAWLDMGKPARFNFVELGPGRGTLMADMLRAARQVSPEFVEAACLRLVETSHRLREEQQARIAKTATWYDRFADVPAAPTLLVANEFFDALPIHQYVKVEQGWAERRVAMEPATSGERFSWVHTATPDLPVPVQRGAAKAGDIVEVCPSGCAIVAEIAQTISAHGGAALLIDYGYTRPGFGDTLQAVREHSYHPVLKHLGTADVTAHVNFGDLGAAAKNEGARVFPILSQGTFLKRMGIEQRCRILTAGKPDHVVDSVTSAVERLIAPEEMGTLFKVLAIADEKNWVPAAFENAE